jgi:pheromone shutdown protein TraB
VAEVWVDEEIRLTFRRVFSADMMNRWEDLKYVVEHVVLNDDSYALVWGV